MPTVKTIIENLTFEWDSNKNTSNQNKHGVSFEEALTVLLHDDYIKTIEDFRDYNGEQRYISLGLSNQARILYVVWTNKGNNYRLISARKANKHEQRGYQHG